MLGSRALHQGLPCLRAVPTSPLRRPEMVGVLHSYARGLAGAASSMWQTARGQRNEDYEYGITADGYDDDNDTVQGDAANVNDPSSVCVFSAFHVDALRPFMTISLLVSACSREEGARIVHGVSSLRFMDDSEADKPDAALPP